MSEVRRSLAILLGACLLSAAIFMPASPILAEVRENRLLLNAHDTQDFRSLMQQAESLAQGAIAQGFAANPQLTAIHITIVGERNGQVATLLTTEVNRLQWQSNPNVDPWSQYFVDSAVLLGFRESQIAQPLQQQSSDQSDQEEPDCDNLTANADYAALDACD